MMRYMHRIFLGVVLLKVLELPVNAAIPGPA
jgi:hypothetical protein